MSSNLVPDRVGSGGPAGRSAATRGSTWSLRARLLAGQIALLAVVCLGIAAVTEGALHPGFVRLRATMPAFLNKETSAQDTARVIVRAMAKRQRQIFMPSWLRVLFGLRALLHLPFAERELVKAAPDIEAFYLEGLATEGALASSFGPRARERELARARQAQAGRAPSS
jgi:hypothetical protein